MVASGGWPDDGMDMSQPSVCIVIVNWNGVEHLQGCLPSLEGVTFSSVRTIVVGNGSDISSIQRVTGCAPRIPPDEGLRPTIDYYRQHKEHFW